MRRAGAVEGFLLREKGNKAHLLAEMENGVQIILEKRFSLRGGIRRENNSNIIRI